MASFLGATVTDVDPAAIQAPADFARLPLVTKANYVERYPLAERCRKGKEPDFSVAAH